MTFKRATGFLNLLFVFVLALSAHAAEAPLQLQTALRYALQENPDIKVKRHALGIAEARARQAGLVFQHNPRFSVEVETPTSGNAETAVELNLQQELEIAGQRAYRSAAAAKNLAQARLSLADAERLLRLEVTQTYYQLLALQQAITDLKEVLATQEALLQTAQKRFAREDISVLELNTLRLDRDQVQDQLATKLRERLSMEKQLRTLLGFKEDGSFWLSGNLLELSAGTKPALPDRQALYTCILANRPDINAAKLAVEARDAELRLAQARRVPNISFGPRYKRENDHNIVGGEISVPLPFFNRNQEEIASALANQNVSRAELEGRMLAAKQEIDSAYTRLALARETAESYGISYLGDLEKMLALTRKAYESGEMSIFEFSVTRDRFTQARARSLDAALTYVKVLAELEGRAPGCLK